jgi:hypothetical protein
LALVSFQWFRLQPDILKSRDAAAVSSLRDSVNACQIQSKQSAPISVDHSTALPIPSTPDILSIITQISFLFSSPQSYFSVQFGQCNIMRSL